MVACFKCKCILKNACIPEISWTGLACPKCNALHGRTDMGASVFDAFHSKYHRTQLVPFNYETRQRNREYADYLKNVKPVILP